MSTHIEFHNTLQLAAHAPSPLQIRTLKRFEFSAARALPDGRLSGSNFSGWAGVSGPVNPDTGMQINIAELKEITNAALENFDHHNLSRQLAPLKATNANIAQALYERIQAGLANRMSGEVAVDLLELQEEGGSAVMVSENGIIEIVRAGFSAAHRTHAPSLSAAENEALYGICNRPTGHGHNYVVEAGLADGSRFPHKLIDNLDHRNLNTDVPALAGRNVVTEAIARLIAAETPGAHWLRVWETPDFYAEYHPLTGLYRLGRQYRFHAAHRLESPALSSIENQALYGKCNRPDPHGHTYRVQVSVENPLNLLTGTAYDLGALDSAASEVLGPLQHTYLDEEISFFQQAPSTGENIAAFLYGELRQHLGTALQQVKIWETPNNQFTAE